MFLPVIILAALLEKTKLDASTAATAEKNAATAEKAVEAAAKKAEKDAAIAKEKAAKVSLIDGLFF